MTVMTDRINQPEFFLSIVRIPSNWKPRGVFSVPPRAHLLSRQPVASYEEACEDVARCNQLAIQHGWKEWAIVQADLGDAKRYVQRRVEQRFSEREHSTPQGRA